MWKINSFFNKKLRTDVWSDKNGNSLVHYACMHHSSELWEFSKSFPMDINLVNNFGKAPIHLFIENSFYSNQQKEPNKFKSLVKFLLNYLIILFVNPPDQKPFKLSSPIDSNIGIEVNEMMLEDLVHNGANINQFIRYKEREDNGWGPSDLGSTSLNDILGTPLELLVLFFWEQISFRVGHRENNQTFQNYEKTFHLLIRLGANPNTIVEGRSLEQNIEASAFAYSRVVSLFFTRFVARETDLIAIKPFFDSQHIDFFASDYLGNTVLHTLFGRFSSKKHSFSDQICMDFILSIFNNKNFTKEAFFVKNYAGAAPIDLIRKDATHLKKYIASLVLHEQLQKKLNNKPDEVKEKKVIKKI